MKKARKRSPMEILICLILIVSFAITAIAIVQLVGAGIWVSYEKACAREFYEAQNQFSSDFKEWSEIQQEVKEEFSDGSWAIKMVSGNLAEEAVTPILLLLVASSSQVLVGTWFISKIN